MSRLQKKKSLDEKKKQRDIEARFIVEGLKNIRELFNSEFQIIEVFLTEKILNNHPELLDVVDKSNSIHYKLILEKDLKIFLMLLLKKYFFVFLKL